MGRLYYNLYCDESAVHTGDRFYIGGIHCSPARAVRLEGQIEQFRARTGCVREMKWTKVSTSMLQAYTEFADIFLKDPYATFVLAEMNKGDYWQSLARSEGSRFLQAYFHFLEAAMWASARYSLYLDETTCKRYKWRSMHYALNLPDIRWHRQKKVARFSAVDSHQSSLIQLTDVILGALTSCSTSNAKASLAEYVREQVGKPTQSGRPKLKTLSWTAPRVPRFRPAV